MPQMVHRNTPFGRVTRGMVRRVMVLTHRRGFRNDSHVVEMLFHWYGKQLGMNHPQFVDFFNSPEGVIFRKLIIKSPRPIHELTSKKAEAMRARMDRQRLKIFNRWMKDFEKSRLKSTQSAPVKDRLREPRVKVEKQLGKHELARKARVSALKEEIARYGEVETERTENKKPRKPTAREREKEISLRAFARAQARNALSAKRAAEFAARKKARDEKRKALHDEREKKRLRRAAVGKRLVTYRSPHVPKSVEMEYPIINNTMLERLREYLKEDERLTFSPMEMSSFRIEQVRNVLEKWSPLDRQIFNRRFALNQSIRHISKSVNLAQEDVLVRIDAMAARSYRELKKLLGSKANTT